MYSEHPFVEGFIFGMNLLLMMPHPSMNISSVTLLFEQTIQRSLLFPPCTL
jgi:hypothetical protein